MDFFMHLWCVESDLVTVILRVKAATTAVYRRACTPTLMYWLHLQIRIAIRNLDTYFDEYLVLHGYRVFSLLKMTYNPISNHWQWMAIYVY